MPSNSSEGSRLVVVELIGPVVDDSQAVSRTIADTLTRAGLDLLPGALEQVAGMAPAHALRTLAEGHGRFELLEELESLLARTVPQLEAWAMAGTARAVPGAVVTWQRLAEAGSSRAMLTALPADAARRLATRLGATVADDEWVIADDHRGIPHPDHLRSHLNDRAVSGQVVALVQSVGAAMAVAAAGCREVVAVGQGGAAMFADRTIATLADFR